MSWLWRIRRRREERARYMKELEERVARDDARRARILEENALETFRDQYGRLCVSFPNCAPWNDESLVYRVIATGALTEAGIAIRVAQWSQED